MQGRLMDSVAVNGGQVSWDNGLSLLNPTTIHAYWYQSG